MGVVQGIEYPNAQMQSIEGDCCDDLDVPSHLIVQEALGLAISMDQREATCCILQVRQDEDGNLVADSEMEKCLGLQ